MKKSIGPKPLIFPCPVLIVGTYDEKENPNMMNAAWGGVCCSAPVCVAISLRDATYTHGNIMKNNAFTINIPSQGYVAEADYVGMASGRDGNKFKETGLTPVKSDVVHAPLIEEFPVSLECECLHIIELGLHTQFVGEVKDIKVDSSVFTDGKVDIKKVEPLIFSFGTKEYYGVANLLGRAFDVGKKFQK